MQYLSVKNLRRFQHYKDRNPPWIKLYTELLDDYAFGCLQDASKLHLIGIWLLASKCDNRIPSDPIWIAQRIQARSPVDVQVLVDAGFLILEQGASTPLAPCVQDACPEGETETETETEKRPAPKKPARKAAEPKVLAPRPKHWAQPLADAWESRFGAGSFPWTKHVRALAALGELSSEDAAVLGAAFARYLAETEARYASLPAFLAKRLSYLEPQPSGDDRDVAYAEAHGGIWDDERGQLTDAGDLITNPDREQERARKVGAWRG